MRESTQAVWEQIKGAKPKPAQAQDQLPGAMMDQALQKGVEMLRKVSDSHHAAPIHAFIRQGADELSQALVAFPQGSIQPVSEPGQIFEPTSQEVTRENEKKVDPETDRIVSAENKPEVQPRAPDPQPEQAKEKGRSR